MATIDESGTDLPNTLPAEKPHVERREMTPMEMVGMALEKGVSADILKQMMDLRDREEASRARKAFDMAIARAKAEIPVITKNREGHNNKRYADFSAYARVIDPILGKYGLSYRFRTAQTDKISVTCVLSHEAGHYEENTLSGPADATGAKNAIQAIGSTLQYLCRYSLTQALGLAAAEDDDGKAAGAGETITDEQAATLRALIEETSTDIEQFCKFAKIESVPELPAAHYQRAIDTLEAKKRKLAS